jgi:aryl-phospho-beta-D-glucosidase BglC (GH1 family)
MKTKTIIGVFAVNLGAIVSSWAIGSVTGQVSASQVDLTWPSQVNHEYTIMLSTNLTEGYTEYKTIQATPPLNTWWEDLGHDTRFYTLSRPLATNTPPPSSTEINQTSNGDFSNGMTDWSSGTAGSGVATISESGGEAFADITDGGTSQFHVFLRQTDLTLSNGVSYTVRFDARAAAARDIQIILKADNGAGINLISTPVSIGTGMATYEVPYTMTEPTQLVRLHFGLGNSNDNVWLDNVEVFHSISTGTPTGNRAVAHEINRRMGRGNNFMASKSMNEQGAPEDYALLNDNYFNHCRIGYKLNEVAGAGPSYTIPANEMQNLQNMVDWCLAEGLVANVDPVHNWAAEPGFTNPTDLSKFSNIWVQVATHFADYDKENVVFEIINEPRADDIVADIINTGLAAIRSVAGNEERVVIVCGDGFSTRQALIDALDNDDIPSDDPFLIGTFHYYDPFTFTKSTRVDYDPNWGTSAEFAQVITDFDAVLTANTNWAVRNNTEPLPIYLGEFGVDNEADLHGTDRKKWLSWIRMQAEAHSMSWAHWNMYQNQATSKGMGPWTSTEINNPDQRYFDADPVEALIGRYEFEDGSKGGGVATDTTHAGYTGTGYAAFPAGAGVSIWARVDGLYIPTNGTYTVQIHYASETAKDLRLVSRNDLGTTIQTINNQTFPATGGSNSWKTIEIPVDFEAGDAADLKIVATPDEGVQLDWLKITH